MTPEEIDEVVKLGEETEGPIDETTFPGCDPRVLRVMVLARKHRDLGFLLGVIEASIKRDAELRRARRAWWAALWKRLRALVTRAKG